MKFKSNLRTVREMQKLSQTKLAKKLSISPAALCRMEQEGVKTITQAEKLGKVLKVNPLILLESS